MDEEQEQPTESTLVAELERQLGATCLGCGQPLCGHAVLCSVALGFKSAPRCPACLATGLRRPAGALLDQLTDYIQRRDCYRRAWDVASDRERVPRSARPGCVMRGLPAAGANPVDESAPALDSGPACDWDAGHMACGDLVLELRLRLKRLSPGALLCVTALDPGAPEDLPAWCRLTGHRLVRVAHPEYLIQRKEG